MKFARFFPKVIGNLVGGLIVFVLVANAPAEQPPTGENFPGVQKALTPEQYAGSGLSKLSPEERANLDNYLRGYFTGATQRVVEQATQIAATKAVDQAVKERKVQPPQLIESRIIGKLNGWKSGQIFVLENGQHWKIADDGDRYFRALENPEVFIVRDILSYKMAVAGAGTTRVIRVR